MYLGQLLKEKKKIRFCKNSRSNLHLKSVFSAGHNCALKVFFTAEINYQIIYLAFHVLHKAMSLSSML